MHALRAIEIKMFKVADEIYMDSSIRVIQYLGSKLKILDDIKDEIDKITPKDGVVVDLFAGTGVVANFLAKDYKVIANDIQAYSDLISRVLIKNMKTSITYDDLIRASSYKKNKSTLQRLFKDILDFEEKVLENEDYDKLAFLCESEVFYNGQNIDDTKKKAIKAAFGDSLNLFSSEEIDRFRKDKRVYALFSLYYSNSYFSMQQCIEIDSLRKAIDDLSDKELYDSSDKQVLLVCLMHAVSEIVSSVGKNFAQPIKVIDGKGKIKKFAISRCMRDRKLCIENPFRDIWSEINEPGREFASDNNESYNLDAIEFLNNVDLTNVQTVYLDPPYTIDHYSRFYHVLETLVKYDYPELEEKTFHGEKRLMNGRYRNDRVQSNYCIPSKGKDEFSVLISKIAANKKCIVLSYSDSDDEKETRKRVVSKDELMGILRDNYPQVIQKNITHKYRKLSSKDSNRREYEDSELIFICHY